MENSDSIAVHPFGSGILVELIGVDESGDISTETIEFDVIEADTGKVKPRENIPSEHEEAIRSELSENGYSLVEIC